MEVISSTETFLQTHYIKVPKIWLESCIDFCKTENLQSNYTLKDLQVAVVKQWIISDIRDIGMPCLPPNLSNQRKTIIRGTYVLQLLKIVDISKPKYWQLQRIRNGVPKNLEKEFESSSRMLQLTFTDGVQEVEAMEYKPIKCLHLNLCPGVKMRLMGPIEIRRGQLILEEKHVKILGGEVEALLVENATENILAKSLNLPINPKPQIIQDSVFKEEGDNNEADFSSLSINNTNGQKANITNVKVVSNNSTNIQSINRVISNNAQKINITHEVISNNSKVQCNKEDIPDFDDDFCFDQEIDMLMECENEFKAANIQPAKVNQPRSKTPDMFEDLDDEFENVDFPDFQFSSSKVDLQNKKESISNIEPERKESSICSFKSESNQNVSTKSVSSSEKSIIPIKPVVWPIEKLLKTIPNVTNGKFKIKASVKDVVQKLQIINEEYSLVIEVQDDTGCLIVKIQNAVVEELVGIPVRVFIGYKEALVRKELQIEQKVFTGLKSLRDQMLALDNIMEVLINPNNTYPLIVKIYR